MLRAVAGQGLSAQGGLWDRLLLEARVWVRAAVLEPSSLFPSGPPCCWLLWPLSACSGHSRSSGAEKGDSTCCDQENRGHWAGSLGAEGRGDCEGGAECGQAVWLGVGLEAGDSSVGGSLEEFRSSGQLGHWDVPGVPDGQGRGCCRLGGAGGFSSGKTAQGEPRLCCRGRQLKMSWG